jgi:hypothetical protein
LQTGDVEMKGADDEAGDPGLGPGDVENGPELEGFPREEVEAVDEEEAEADEQGEDLVFEDPAS